MIINGQPMQFEDVTSITTMLQKLGLSPGKVVVEVNMDIVPKEQFDGRILNEEDTIEVVSFVGGG